MSDEVMHGFGDFTIQYNTIDKMEEKRSAIREEAKIVHEATVKEWDKLYESLKALADKHKNSPAFKDSQIYKKWFVPTDAIAVAFEGKREGLSDEGRWG